MLVMLDAHPYHLAFIHDHGCQLEAVKGKFHQTYNCKDPSECDGCLMCRGLVEFPFNPADIVDWKELHQADIANDPMVMTNRGLQMAGFFVDELLQPYRDARLTWWCIRDFYADLDTLFVFRIRSHLDDHNSNSTVPTGVSK